MTGRRPATLTQRSSMTTPKNMGDGGTFTVIDDHTHDDPASINRGFAWRPDSPLGASSYPDVAPLSRNNPQWIRAWKALYGYKHSDFAPEHLSALLAAKR